MTNFYLDAPNSERHLGRRGYEHFTAMAPEGVDSFDDWAGQLDGHEIFAEWGFEVTAAELIAATVPTGKRSTRPGAGQWIERGILFTRRPFF